MKKNKFWIELWSKYGKFVFAGASLLFLLIVLLCGSYDGIMLTFAVIVMLIAFFRLDICNLPIKSVFVRAGWSLIMGAVFVLVVPLLTYNKDGFIHHFPGYIAAYIVVINIYAFSSIISYHMKLNDLNSGCAFWPLAEPVETKLNGVLLWLLVSTVLFISLFVIETHQYDNYRFSKAEFTDVISWEKEIYQGKTVYIVTTKDGTFSISPWEYPAIRKINPNTKLKILYDQSNDNNKNQCLPVKRLEIKN